MCDKYEWEFDELEQALANARSLWRDEREGRLAVFVMEDMDLGDDEEGAQGTVELWRVDDDGEHVRSSYSLPARDPKLRPDSGSPRQRLSSLAERRQ